MQKKKAGLIDFITGDSLYPSRNKEYLVNKCRCKACNDIIESKNRHDFVSCKCGSIFTDGGLDYIRRGGKDLSLIEDLSVKIQITKELYKQLFMSLFEKIRNFLVPERMQKVNAVGAIFNLFCAIVVVFVGLPSVYAQIFLASGFCFVIGGLANWQMARMNSKNDK